MKLLFILINLFLISFSFADVVYEKTNLKDPFGKTIVKLKIENEIQEGDYDAFNEAIIDINQNDYRVDQDSVILNSRGGLMYDARKIGYLVRYNHLATKVNRFDECSSACTSILVSGTCRMSLGKVRLHNSWTNEPIDGKDYVKSLTKWSSQYEDEFLKQMDATQEFIDIGNVTQSWDYYRLSKDEKRRMGLYGATNGETKYRLEIASRKLGKSKKDILEVMKAKSHWLGIIPRQMSCSEQFFVDQLENQDLLTDSVVEENFEFNEAKQFFVKQPNGQPEIDHRGEIKRNYSKEVPLEDGNALIWEIQHYSKGKTVEYKELTTLTYPGNWQFTEGKLPEAEVDVQVSDDGKVATKIMKVENTGYLVNGWSLDPKFDKPGPVRIEIFVDNKWVYTFNFEVVDPKSKK
jgi:hypothetical protein